MVNVPVVISSGGRLRLFALVHTAHVSQIHSTALTASLPLTDETQVSPGGVWVNIYAEAVTPRAAAGSGKRLTNRRLQNQLIIDAMTASR